MESTIGISPFENHHLEANLRPPPTNVSGQETFEARPHEAFLFYFSGSGMETQAGAKGASDLRSDWLGSMGYFTYL